MLAQVNDGLFAVGYAPLPESLRKNEALRAEMGRQVMESFYQGLHLPVPGELPEFGKPFSLQSPGKNKRSEEHTSELQSLMRISYAVFCLKKKTTVQQSNTL